MKGDTFLRTTINCNEELLIDLKQRCKEKDVSVTFLIKKAVKLFLDNMKKDDYKWCTLTYQQKGLKYKKFHIKLKAYEYDVYLDAKKVTRLSFSHLVALALGTFADQILDGEEEVDSYPLSAYSKYCIVDDNCTFYVFSWGISRNSVEITLPPIVEIDSNLEE
jgi:hypothetical protein